MVCVAPLPPPGSRRSVQMCSRTLQRTWNSPSFSTTACQLPLHEAHCFSLARCPSCWTSPASRAAALCALSRQAEPLLSCSLLQRLAQFLEGK